MTTRRTLLAAAGAIPVGGAATARPIERKPVSADRAMVLALGRSGLAAPPAGGRDVR